MRPLTAFAIVCWLFVAQALAGTEDSTSTLESSTFHVDARLVRVDVQVINKKTHQIADSLKQDDLQVYEDGSSSRLARSARTNFLYRSFS